MEKKRESGISKRSPSKTKATQSGTLKKPSTSRVDGAEEDIGKGHASTKWTVVAVLIPKEAGAPSPDVSTLADQMAMMKLSESRYEKLKNKEKTGTSKTSNENGKRQNAGRKMSNETENKVAIISRKNWKALIPFRKLIPRRSPFTIVVVGYIFLKHDILLNKCAAAVQEIQKYSMSYFDDILCHFVVGKNSQVYEGRGWDAEGEFKETINIAFTGNNTDFPSSKEILACKKLIQEGVKLGKIDKDYQLYTYPFHRLYYEVMKWENFVPCR